MSAGPEPTTITPPTPVPLGRRERASEAALGVALLVAAGGLALVPGQRPLQIPLAALLVLVYAGCTRVRFWVGREYTVPVQLALVPMLVLLPAALVPVAAATGLLLGRLPGRLWGGVPSDRLLRVLPDSWYTIGPALVVAFAGQDVLSPGRSQWALVPVLAGMLVAQFAVEIAASAARDALAFGEAPRLRTAVVTEVLIADAALAPIALVVGLVARGRPLAILAVPPVLALLAVFARERDGRIAQADELAHAYRGTALLMSDLLEADDAYTGGEHSRGVVGLAVEVGGRMGIGGESMRDLEFAALLHDIGKIHVPDAIINKPGRLDPEEWALIRRHPADGQRMLDRVGGVLSGVGAIVRAHHESYDGSGYPDGLAAAAIPLAARIISVCDAYSAMTTDRSYRAARPAVEAVAELRRCAGSQFDPLVVEVLASGILGLEAEDPVSAGVAA